MKRSVVIALAMLLLASCNTSKPQVMYLDYGSTFLVAIQDKESLVVLSFPNSLVEGLKGGQEIGRFEALDRLTLLQPGSKISLPPGMYDQLKEYSTTLVVNQTGAERTAVNDCMRLQAIVGNASGLRKTAFAATLATMTGMADPLGSLEPMKRILVLDMGEVFELNELNDWESMRQFFHVYLEGVLQFQRRSMTE